jgi:AcrR family transcriptional regulator
MTAAERREQLLDAMMEIVAEQGFPAVSIQSVAQRAGISRPIVYEHFGDLPGLLKALVKREMARALAQVSETALGEMTADDPFEQLLESLRTYLGAVERHPNTWRLLLMPPEGAPAVLRKGIANGRSAVLNRLVRDLSPDLAPAGAASDLELTARMLSSIGDEYARLLLIDPQRFTRDRLLAHARWSMDHFAR